MTDAAPYLQYGALGILAFLLAMLVRPLIAALKDNAASNRDLLKMLAEGEAKAVDRHHQTREMCTTSVAEAINNALNVRGDLRTIVSGELAVLLNETRSVRQLDEAVRDTVVREMRDTRHEIRNAIFVGANGVCEHVDQLMQPIIVKTMGWETARKGTPLPFPAVNKAKSEEK